MGVLIIVFCVSLWVSCGLIAFGFMNTYARHRWPILHETKKEVLMGMVAPMVFGMAFGVIALLMSVVFCEFYRYGWTISLKPIPDYRKDQFEVQMANIRNNGHAAIDDFFAARGLR